MLGVSIALTIALVAAAFACGFAVAIRMVGPYLEEPQGTTDPQAEAPG